LLGVALHQQGEHHQAAESIGRAVTLNLGNAAYHANLGEAYRALGNLDGAAECCRTALRLEPRSPEAANNLGLVLLAQGKTDEAILQFRQTLRIKPDYGMACNNLGNALRLGGDLDGAMAHFRRAVEIEPNLVEARSNLGQLLLERHQPHEALRHLREAVRLCPSLAEARNNLGNALRETGRLAEARQSYAEALRINPSLAMTYNNMGQALQEENSLDDAMAWYQRALQLDPGSARIHCNTASLLAGQEKYDDALAGYRRALELDPTYAEAHRALGTVREELGDFKEAESCWRTALRYDPRQADAYAALATLLRGKLPEEDLAGMHKLLADPDLHDGRRSALHFGLAQVLDARGAYPEAAESLRQANALALAAAQKRGQGYDPAVHARFVAQMITVCSPSFFERTRGIGMDSARPIFIVGLPRSGTTLTEQILASHSQVFGAGELRLSREDFEALAPQEDQALEVLLRLDRATAGRLGAQHLERLRALNDDRRHVADKMPDNYMYLGLLAALFPQAKFIHCRRDLRDTAVSCWMTNFRHIRWANDPGHIATRFAEYRRLMEHWRRVLPVPVLEVDYEETVADLEGVARRLVSWCGLEWERGCLRFHEGKGPVRTASVSQVRQPIYQRSVARWKHYEQALGPLFYRLGDASATWAAAATDEAQQ
jgi:tetratricopeptide (TPR) repeat protein